MRSPGLALSVNLWTKRWFAMLPYVPCFLELFLALLLACQAQFYIFLFDGQPTDMKYGMYNKLYAGWWWRMRWNDSYEMTVVFDMVWNPFAYCSQTETCVFFGVTFKMILLQCHQAWTAIVSSWYDMIVRRLVSSREFWNSKHWKNLSQVFCEQMLLLLTSLLRIQHLQ